MTSSKEVGPSDAVTPSLEESPPPASTAEALDHCHWHHNLLVAANQIGDQRIIVEEVKELVQVYDELKAGKSPEELAGCRNLIEPTLRDIANHWYIEGRPGHPDTYPATRSLLSTLLELFPKSSEAPMLTYRLAEVVAVIASDEQSADLWREAAGLYARSAAADSASSLTLHRGTRTRDLREVALRAKELCLTNSSDPSRVREVPWHW